MKARRGDHANGRQPWQRRPGSIFRSRANDGRGGGNAGRELGESELVLSEGACRCVNPSDPPS